MLSRDEIGVLRVNVKSHDQHVFIFSPQTDMAGVGADCPRQKKNSKSCFGKGKIDANWEGAPEPCSYARGISGVICCRNRVVGKFILIHYSEHMTSFRSRNSYSLLLTFGLSEH